MAKPNMVGKVVVVRSGQSGVHVGKLLASAGDRVWLADAQRLWSWKVAKQTQNKPGNVATCSEIATNGIVKSESRLATKLAVIEIGSVCETIPATKEAQQTWA